MKRPLEESNDVVEEEEDYMTMKFEDEEEQQKEIKPKQRPRKEMEHERRQVGLQTKINEKNIGYKLLKKMGFNKEIEEQQEPVAIQIHKGKSGLGSSTPKEDKKEEIIKFDQKFDEAAFINEQKKRLKQKLLLKDLDNARDICKTLDMKKGIESNPLWLEEETEKVENDAKQQLELLTDYLNQQHFYCLWCMTAYNDMNDLKDNCPGNSREAHD